MCVNIFYICDTNIIIVHEAPPVRVAPVVGGVRRGVRGRVRSGGRAAGCVVARGGQPDDAVPFKSYSNRDVSNPLPVFTSFSLLRNTMTTEVEFSNLFFTDDMVNDIVTLIVMPMSISFKAPIRVMPKSMEAGRMSHLMKSESWLHYCCTLVLWACVEVLTSTGV